jgi:hypothetical protein
VRDRLGSATHAVLGTCVSHVADLASSHSATFSDAFHASIVSMRPRSTDIVQESARR